MESFNKIPEECGAQRCVLLSPVTSLLMMQASDGWVVGRISNGRELYVILDNKTGNLVEVTDEVNKIASSYFSNIFI